MEDWKIRVIQEKDSLDIKRKKLYNFIQKSYSYEKTVGIASSQLKAMDEYSHILERRIFEFDE